MKNRERLTQNFKINANVLTQPVSSHALHLDYELIVPQREGGEVSVHPSVVRAQQGAVGDLDAAMYESRRVSFSLQQQFKACMMTF